MKWYDNSHCMFIHDVFLVDLLCGRPGHVVPVAQHWASSGVFYDSFLPKKEQEKASWQHGCSASSDCHCDQMC